MLGDDGREPPRQSGNSTAPFFMNQPVRSWPDTFAAQCLQDWQEALSGSVLIQ